MTFNPLPPVTGPHLLGVDLYHGDAIGDNPDSIQMHALTDDGASFVILKAGQSTKSNDPTFKAWWQRAKEAGLKRGAYLFFDPVADPIAQADHLMSLVTLEPGDIPFTLDVETQGPSVAAHAFTAAQHIKEKTGYWPWLYSGDSMYQGTLARQFPANMHTLWIARYGHRPVTPCAMWQYSDAGRLPGINHELDLNVFFGDAAALAKKCVK